MKPNPSDNERTTVAAAMRRESMFWIETRLVAGLLALATLVVASAAQAAPSFENPHGDLSISCSECHSTEGWSPLLSPLPFDHASTGFDLAAGHRTVECVSCHRVLEFANVASACADCHLDPHLGELGFSCESCHDPRGWDPRSDLQGLHDTTLFPLTGAHRAADCAACHREDPPFEFQLTPLECFECHADDYTTAELDHVALGFPTRCEECHGTLDWRPATIGGGDFDHDAFFPLRGSHATLDCGDCHGGGFGGTPSDCYACHADDYASTDDPDHEALGFPLHCEECHGTTTWEGATNVEHDSFFPLNGVHAVLDCQECHAGGFQGTPTDCVACHQADYDSTRDPDHAAQGFSTSCENCHGESSWDVTDIDHDAFFPLQGAHRILDCEACHATGFAGTPTDCVACHREDYDSTTDPDHAAEGFPLDCEACHGQSSWEGAVLDHDAFWPLTGQHAVLDCEACHASGFEGTPTDCVACHQADYDATEDPDHAAAGFPTTCEESHDTSDWEDADFDHDQLYFPIYSGRHQGVWDDCTDCHVVPSDFGVFECIFCHEHNQADMDEEHEDVGGYVYESQACYNCHPNGEE